MFDGGSVGGRRGLGSNDGIASLVDRGVCLFLGGLGRLGISRRGRRWLS